MWNNILKTLYTSLSASFQIKYNNELFDSLSLSSRFLFKKTFICRILLPQLQENPSQAKVIEAVLVVIEYNRNNEIYETRADDMLRIFKFENFYVNNFQTIICGNNCNLAIIHIFYKDKMEFI